ncbi:MAG: hypothetical protein KatS3mg105_3329 [Gemmatales bacterium]|nr:MAG: hypothetical protein KatS3mg105_3329 [Gemmatales bacterium]
MAFMRKMRTQTKWTPDRIRSLRESYNESQAVFCTRLGVGVDTLRIWEQGRGTPNGSAQILLDRLEQDLSEAREQQTEVGK